MAIYRHYLMTAAEGKGETLRAALAEVKAQFLALPGCQRVDILRDLDTPERFVMLQLWESRNAHQAAFPTLPKAALGGVMEALTAPPQGSYIEIVA